MLTQTVPHVSSGKSYSFVIQHYNEMLEFLRDGTTQCRFVSMKTRTEPKIKASCPWKGVYKLSRRNGLINANYNNSVQRRIAEKFNIPESSVTYIPGETWYVHEKRDDKTLPVVVNKKDIDNPNAPRYIQFFPHSSTNRYFDMYNAPLSEEQLKLYFYKRPEKEDCKPIVNVISLVNVLELKASGVILECPAFDDLDRLFSTATIDIGTEAE